MLTTQLPGLYIIGSENKKRCVFCSEKIEKGSTIELSHVIVLNAEDTKAIHKTSLHNYYFLWDVEKGTSAIALGFGSLYNHSDDPNTDFEIQPAEELIRFFAVKDIEAGEELCIDYIGLKDAGARLWFEPV